MFFGRFSESSGKPKPDPEKVYGVAPRPEDTKIEVEKKTVTTDSPDIKNLLRQWEQKTNSLIAPKFVCPSCGEVFDNAEIVGCHAHIKGQNKVDSNLKIVPICINCSKKFTLHSFDVVERFVVSVN